MEERHAYEYAEAEDRENPVKAEVRLAHREKSCLQAKLANFRDLFSSKRHKEIESRSVQIESEIRNL